MFAHLARLRQNEKLDSNSLFTSQVVIGKSHPDFVSDPYIADFRFLPGVRYIFGLFHQVYSLFHNSL